MTVELAVSRDYSELRLIGEFAPKLLSSLTLPHDITLREFTVGGTEEDKSLRFYPDGTASPGRITLASASGNSCEIVQALRGARRWQCLSGRS